MAIPSADAQVQFLANVQRILVEGDFVATYKYALLLSLADIAVERGDDSGNALTVSTDEIAEKFVGYYWRHVVPFVPRTSTGTGSGLVLRQNTGQGPAVLRLIKEAHRRYEGRLSRLFADNHPRQQLVGKVARVVLEMPLWRLQKVGDQILEFLYPNTGHGRSIELKPGVVYCLRKFHGMITDMVRGAWLRYIRRQNTKALGDNIDLEQFLFGANREDLTVIRPVLRDLQNGECFYCKEPLKANPAVDHFVPWSMFPLNLGHNLVLAHKDCNSAKSDRLACHHHLESWHQRNADHGNVLATECERVGIIVDLPATIGIVQWAYRRAENHRGLVWHEGKQLETITVEWSRIGA